MAGTEVVKAFLSTDNKDNGYLASALIIKMTQNKRKMNHCNTCGREMTSQGYCSMKCYDEGRLRAKELIGEKVIKDIFQMFGRGFKLTCNKKYREEIFGSENDKEIKQKIRKLS